MATRRRTRARVACVAAVALFCTPVAESRPNIFTKEDLCNRINLLTNWSDTVSCQSEKTAGGHLISVFEGSWAHQQYTECDSYLVMHGANMWSRSTRGALFLIALLYTFLGIAIVADVFMNAIEVITSKEIDREIAGEDGKPETIKVKYWNDTIANLSLMALGSSAPEILLAVIGVVTALPPEEADVLGPGTIVGSASFNLLFITAICILSPSPNTTKVEQYGVFLITAFFAVEAYIWLLIIIDFNTPEVIDIWEAVVTLLHFPLMLVLAYGQDRNWNFKNYNKVLPSDGEHPGDASQYTKFRRNAIRYFTGGKRVMWKDDHSETHDVAHSLEASLSVGKNIRTSDPYAVLRLGKQIEKTQWIRKNLNPKWNETFTFENVDDLLADGALAVDVFDHDDLTSDDLMGVCDIPLARLQPGTELEMWYKLGKNARKFGVEQGEICLSCLLTCPVTSESSLRVSVLSARDLPGLDKNNKYIDKLASAAGARIKKLKRQATFHRETYRRMKVDWQLQFKDALLPNGEKDDNGDDLEPSGMDLTMHFLTVFWKVFFACIPPTNYYGGWLTFYTALSFIGLVTAVVGELAETFGCIVGLKDSVTAITFVALGTSLPDTFASKVAARESPVADAAIGNVTGSNAVNVFLGIGIPWTMAAVYAEVGDKGAYISRSCGFGLSVGTYCVCAGLAVAVLTVRRRLNGGELGGNVFWARVSAAFLVTLWLVYIIVSSLRAYDHIGDIWTITTDASSPAVCP